VCDFSRLYTAYFDKFGHASGKDAHCVQSIDTAKLAKTYTEFGTA